jgi:iron complex outermembrane receptor protein/outer membrane receptor for ferrienterochelin and colicins
VGERKINPSLTLKARTFYVDHEDEIEDVGQGDHQTKKKWFEKSGYDDYSQGGEFQALYNLGKRNELRAGFNFIRDHHRQQDFLDDQSLDVISGKKAVGWQTPETYEADTWSLGLEDEFKPNDRLSYVVGLSYDYFNPRKAFNQPTPGNVSSVNPQAGVVLDLTPKTTLHASVGKKIRFPHLKELYSTLGGGNPDLKPQKALAYEVGAEHRFNPSLRGSMALFYNDIKDLIEQVNVGDNRIYQNIGKARIQGVEMGLEKTLSSHSSLGANYTYLSARDRDNHRELEGRPRHRLNLDFRRQFSAGLDASLQASYTQRQFEYDRDGNPFQRPDFLLLNFRVSKKQGEQWGGQTEYFLEVTNVTDRDYYESKPMPGRNFRIGYSQEW